MVICVAVVQKLDFVILKLQCLVVEESGGLGLFGVGLRDKFESSRTKLEIRAVAV